MTKRKSRIGLDVSHVADFYRRYPGELVTLYTRVDVRLPSSGLTVRVTLPRGLAPEASRALAGPHASVGDGAALLEVDPDAETSHFVWQAPSTGSGQAAVEQGSMPAEGGSTPATGKQELPAGTRCEYQVQAKVAPTERDVTLESCAVATCDAVPTSATLAEPYTAEETVAISVPAKGRYLRYLPALYQDDELMVRFLMLFESFWAPVEGQIDHLSFYFDPKMTPSDFLPWLASWLDLGLDERWPEERRRQLICSAVSLYRKRGTKRGLQEFLKIYTGEKPQIIEHRARNFCLGPDGLLGPGIALGRDNVPHTFAVTLRLPPVPGEDEEERTRKELESRRIIQAIIEAEKPAHTGYELRLEVDPELGVRET